VIYVLAIEGGERNDSDAIITIEAGMRNFKRKNTLTYPFSKKYHLGLYILLLRLDVYMSTNIYTT
jgi:hypothetical protein